jgi:ribonuclease Z
MAARVASEAKAKTLIMTHFSPRYGKDGAVSLEDLLAEAQAIFPNTLLARDRWTYPVPRRMPAEPSEFSAARENPLPSLAKIS